MDRVAAVSRGAMAEAVTNTSLFVFAAFLLSGVLETRKRLFSNVSWQQALEMLFFEIVSGGK